MNRVLVLTVLVLSPVLLLADTHPLWQDENGVRIGGAAIPMLDAGNSPANARADAWAPLGPYGGDIEDVAASPVNANIVLAGLAPSGSSGGTLYRSTDAGATWAPVAQLAGKSVFGIEFDPTGVAYIATDDAVWKSVNGGANWTQLNCGLGANDTCHFVIVKPGNPNEIWAGVDDHLGNQPKNVIRSTDAGTTWVSVEPPMSPMACYSIGFDPTNTNKVYACFGGFGGGGAFWFSPDNGVTWFNRSGGLPNRPLKDIVHDGTRVLVGGGQLFGSQFVGIYASADDGQNWTALSDASWPIQVVNDIALDPANPAIIYAASPGAGVYRSTDAGRTWEFRVGGTGSMSLNAVRFVPNSPGTLYLGATSLGVIKSTDAGAHFVPSSVGIGALLVNSVAANPHNTNELAIGFEGQNSGGVYTSLDGGQTWTLATCPGTRYKTVRFHPNGTLYAISTGPTSVAPEGVYRRNPDNSWTSIGPDQGPLYESELEGLAFATHDPNVIIAAGSDFGVAGWKMTVWLTTDGGAHWNKVFRGAKDFQHANGVALDPDGTDLIYVASYNDTGDAPQIGGVLRTFDGGQSWAPAPTGLGATPKGYAIAASNLVVGTFYFADAMNPGGAFRSTDAGLSWTNTGFTAAIQDVECDLREPNTLYIMQQNSTRVLKSTNGGATFTAFNTGLASAGTPMELSIAPGKLLLATSSGVYLYRLTRPGDLNCDGAVNFDDINPFVQVLSDPAGWQQQYPGCPLLNGDCNGDGLVNFDDINAFVALLSGP